MTVQVTRKAIPQRDIGSVDVLPRGGLAAGKVRLQIRLRLRGAVQLAGGLENVEDGYAGEVD